MSERIGVMVDRHPDSDTLVAFREHRLSGSVVAEVAMHLGRCAHCASAEPSAGASTLEALVLRDAEEHLSDEQHDILIDERVHDPSYRAISRHAATCMMCSAEVDDLRRFAEREAELNVGRGFSPPAPPERRAEATPYVQLGPRAWFVAAAVLFTVVALTVIALLLRRTPTPTTASNPPAQVTATQPAPRTVASVVDGAGRIALLEDGTISGVELRTPRDGEDARAVLSGRAIAIPTFIVAMPGAVRGDSASVHPLHAIAPFRSAVRDARPRFSWTTVHDARSYRVAVFDADYEEITRSEALNGTSWTPSQSLPTGVDLSWHVVTETAAGEISSAGSGRGEAVFRVLTPNEAAEVAAGEDHYRDSHLLLGLLYSRYGLQHDAEREFRRVAKQNPGSPIARALLDSISR